MSHGKSRALMLAHRIPYPPNKGDKIRSWHLLKFLAERYELALGTFIDDPADEIHKDRLEAICARTLFIPLSSWEGRKRALKGFQTGQPLSFAWYEDDRMRAFVARERGKGLAAEFYFSGAMTIYQDGASAPCFVDLVDADSAKWASYAKEGLPFARLLHAREARKVARAEAEAVRQSAMSFLVSPEEAGLLSDLPEMRRDHIDWFRNGIDLDFWRPDAGFTRLTHPFDIVFTGAMDYRPNAEAALWYAKFVWPVLRAHYPQLTFGIVGRDPTRAVQHLGNQPGITVTGRVDDVRPFLADAKVAVAPLAIARGIQNKVLEAMAMGIPVVASPGAIAGTAAVPDQHLLMAEGATEMARKTAKLLDDRDYALALGRAGQALMQADYPWEKTLSRLAAHLPGR